MISRFWNVHDERAEATALATLYDTVMAVQDGAVDAALVPIENSLEGSVDVTLDTLAIDAPEVAIVGETVAEIRNCLIAAAAARARPRSRRCTRTHRPTLSARSFSAAACAAAKVIPTSSTADAVRSVTADPQAPHAALGNRLAATLYGGQILLEDVDDHAGNQTRFVWLARAV